MKLNAIKFTFPVMLLLLTVLTSFTVVTQFAAAANSAKVNSHPVYRHKSPGAHHKDDTAVTEVKKNNKKILIEDSRKMSPFFKLGIAINIIMIVVFSWWFSTQWRAKK